MCGFWERPAWIELFISKPSPPEEIDVATNSTACRHSDRAVVARASCRSRTRPALGHLQRRQARRAKTGLAQTPPWKRLVAAVTKAVASRPRRSMRRFMVQKSSDIEDEVDGLWQHLLRHVSNTPYC